MNALSRIKPQRTHTFKAWRTTKDTQHNEAHPLPVDADTLADAVEQAAPSCHHKDTLLVLATDAATRKSTLHSYAIVRKAAKYVRNPVTGLTDRISPLEPSLLFSVAVSEFAPVEPWRWSPGADVVGVDRSLITQNSPA